MNKFITIRQFVIACCVVGIFSLSATAHGQSTSADWSSFRGDAQSTGKAVAGDVVTSDELEEIWKFKLDDGGFESAAAIVQTQQYAQPTVFVAGLTNSVKGKLFALNLTSGEARWEFDAEDGFLTTPLFHDGHLFLGDMAGVFYCVDVAGDQKWIFKTDIEINSSANIYKDRVLFGSQDGALYAVNKDSGEMVWKHATEDQIQCSVTVAKNKAFMAGCDSMLHIVDLDSGQEKGSLKIAAPTIATPAARGSTVFFGNEKGDFFAVDCDKVKIKWQQSDDLGGNSFRSSAAISDGHVVVGARNRKLYSFNPETGAENWTVTLKNKVDSSPVIVKNRVIAASTDGRLYLIDIETGNKVWEKQFNGRITGSPAFAHGVLVIATDAGVVHGLKFKPQSP